MRRWRPGEDGHFEADGLPAGKVPVSVTLKGARGIPSLREEVMVPTDHPLTLVVSVPPRGRIDGRVIVETPRNERVRVEVRSAAQGLVDLVRVDAGGTFSVTVPLDEECSLSAITPRGESAVAEHVRAGADVELRLRAAATLRGVMRNAPPVFEIWLTRTGREEVFFARDGSWEMRGVPAGEAGVEASAAGLVARAKVTLAPGEIRTIDLELAPPREDPAEDEEP